RVGVRLRQFALQRFDVDGQRTRQRQRHRAVEGVAQARAHIGGGWLKARGAERREAPGGGGEEGGGDAGPPGAAHQPYSLQDARHFVLHTRPRSIESLRIYIADERLSLALPDRVRRARTFSSMHEPGRARCAAVGWACGRLYRLRLYGAVDAYR